MTSFLLVEPDEQVRLVIKEMIQSLGHVVVAVDASVTATSILRYVCFDFLVTEYDDALIGLAEQTVPRTKVILLLNQKYNVSEIIRFNGFLQKPFSISTLREALTLLEVGPCSQKCSSAQALQVLVGTLYNERS